MLQGSKMLGQGIEFMSLMAVSRRLLPDKGRRHWLGNGWVQMLLLEMMMIGRCCLVDRLLLLVGRRHGHKGGAWDGSRR